VIGVAAPAIWLDRYIRIGPPASRGRLRTNPRDGAKAARQGFVRRQERTLTVADIVSEIGRTIPGQHSRSASVTASGVSQSDATRFSADNIEFGDVEIGVTGDRPQRDRLPDLQGAADHVKKLFRARRLASASGHVVHIRSYPVRT